ncbi:MAG: hypothetical protein C0624_09915 [Desulfuromonas sp.]|nr:MAG: hypothetical protein C0624_09915 [Desulfuromonas sp.]
MKRLLFAGLLCFLALLPAAVHAGLVEGRLVFNGEPLAGVAVTAYRGYDLTAKPFAVSTPSDAEGRYRLELPEGVYALAARDLQRGLFAFCGFNPVQVGNEPLWAGLQAVAVHPETRRVYASDYAGSLSGVVRCQGKPLADAYVYLYLDANDDLKGQGYRISTPTGADGRFWFDELPESSYYLTARKRQQGERVGPVRAGDMLGVYAGNPVMVAAAEQTEVVIETVAKLGDDSRHETLGRQTDTLLSGRVVDAAGKPLAGLHVFAYTDRVIGHQRPAALSTPTGSDGRFELFFPAGGLYYVGARQGYGDSPAPGELFGMFEGQADHGLHIDKGEHREGVEIVATEIEL